MPALAPSRQPAPDADPLLAAARQRAHDRGAAAHVGAVADHHPRRDASLDHRGAERPGVEVDEALVHHGGALGQVRAEAHAVGVGDPHAGRQHVVGHPRELVDAVHLDRSEGAQPQPGLLETLDRAGAHAGPDHVAEGAEHAVEVDRVGLHEAVGEQVQPQVGVARTGGRGVEVDLHEPHLGAHAARGVVAREGLELRRGGGVGGRRTQGGGREPGVQDGVVGRHGREAVAPGSTGGGTGVGHGARVVGGADASVPP